ncbi:INSIG domain-containing protein [Schizosaccharomyces octosporus yFS286]|uniref:INSIG domain-containing protein n=1 Tax=Schizosaccharomyces octosporus (strain yFS286) TaxID=483514 RepID=S9R027_SCHOY|nr:INSIG domain-containing protein [Schizosaccharomyces octosporus yFS286]EPX71845.1 INSIG domain-containing protein [Schizosaccharomyces octosporus yFS286]
MTSQKVYRPNPRYAEGFPSQGNMKRSISVMSFTSLDNMRSTLSGLFTPLRLEEEELDEDDNSSVHDYEDYASKQKDDDLKKEKRKKRIIIEPNLSLKLLFFKFFAIFGLGSIFTYMAEGILQEAKLSSLTVQLGSWVFKPNWSVAFGLVAMGLAVAYRLMDVRCPSGSAANRRTSQSSQFQILSRYLAAFATLLLTMKKLLSTQNAHSSFVAMVASAATIWYVFDRSKNGFTVSCIMSIIGSIAYYAFVDNTPFSLFEPNPSEYQFRYWIPMILFSASTIVGNAGRLLF